MPRKITVEGIVEVLSESDEPVLDAESIGEEMGVTATTVRNYSQELEAHENVGSMQIDRAKVYYHIPDPSAEEDNTPPESSGGEVSEEIPETLDSRPDGELGHSREDTGGETDSVTQPTGTPDAHSQAISSVFMHALSSGKLPLVGGLVILVGYLHLPVAHVAAGAGWSTVALGLLAMGTIVALTGLMVIIVAAIGNIAIVTDGDGETDFISSREGEYEH